jgi:hypothetical protein
MKNQLSPRKRLPPPYFGAQSGQLAGCFLFGVQTMTNSETLLLLKDYLQWYWCLPDKSAEPGPSILTAIQHNFAILYNELNELDEFLQ